MVFKERTETLDLQILTYLSLRMNLSVKDSKHLFNLNKGYEGEVMFDRLTQNLKCECLIMNDLLLKTGNTMFQIDSFIITSDSIYLFEVKNYDGDYYYESDRLYKSPKSEILNPLIQLDRTESLLRQLLQDLGYKGSIHASVVFINPEFTLYQSPLNKPFIFRSQINRYLNELDATTSKLNQKHKVLAEKLLSLHIIDSPYKQLPSYEYEMVKKGITCVACQSFSVVVKGHNCVCQNCDFIELVEDAVMRSVKEFKLLFPQIKITTNVIHDWCEIVVSKTRIQRILEKNMKKMGDNRGAYYI
ncbi:nuclease-related domain-containing protein [Bacillus salitolerans]|uniref:Nuclease-related domain-containing protein n=1 Tax=Bacillus salitolerans TaxID=1437434 RepID=A0ABW4LW53_9BACI